MEVPHVFGNFNHLVGVVDGPSQSQNNTGVILLTAGMLHHVGPFRMYVNLARRLEQLGFHSLRFDLSGIGESLPVASGGTSLHRAASETSQAMDLMQSEYGIGQFVLFGLCSGADDGFNTALADERVSGVVLIDGCGYPTQDFQKHRRRSHYPPRLRSLTWWRKRFGRHRHDAPRSLQVGADVREFPTRDVAAKQLQSLVDRDVRLRFVYTGGVADYYNHASQFEAMFHDVDFRDRVSSKFYPEMDHVAILCEDRQRLIDDISHWIQENFTDGRAQQNDTVCPEREMVEAP